MDIDFFAAMCYAKPRGEVMAYKAGGINDRRLLNNDLHSDDYLQVNCCGITNYTVEKPMTLRPNGRKDYQLIIVIAGEALFKYGEEDILLKSNEAIILPPHIKNHYYFYPDNNIIWIHFTGAVAEKMLEGYCLQGYTKYSVPDAQDFLYYADKIIEEFQLKRIGYMHNCNAYLLNVFTLLKRKIDIHININENNFIPEITAVLEDMKLHFAENKDIKDFAKICNLSPSRFAHLFTNKVGVSPYKYLLNLRIKQAKYLLLNTNLSLSNIAKSVGYDDSLYFSRVFKKHEGVSPMQFKKDNSFQKG